MSPPPRDDDIGSVTTGMVVSDGLINHCLNWNEYDKKNRLNLSPLIF